MVKHSNQIELISIDRATIPDILRTIDIAEKEGPHFIEDKFIEKIRGRNNRGTFKNLWSLLRKEIRYKADGKYQGTKSPGALWASRVGDCKSFTVFVASVLQKMCIPYNLVLDYYDKDRPNSAHIYVESKGVIIDPVNPVFNTADYAWKRKRIPGKNFCGSVNGLKKGVNPLPIIIILIIMLLYEQ